MRVDPIFKSRHDIEKRLRVKAKTRKIARIVGIILAFGSTFGLFVKILFF